MMKKVLEEVKDAVIYQINLRVFTREGTLSAAEKFLPEVAATGANIVYLCPFVESDEDLNENSWSMRQKRSLTNNPRNPYRLKDFYAIDKEYGNADDVRSFVKKAHSLRLKVMLDLVYMHAGPSFGKNHPSFVKKDEKGNVKLNNYNFCEIDFSSGELREYLWQNMEYFVREFDIDGYRCDVGGAVPLDFWVEGRKRVEKIKKPFIMLNEGEIQYRKADQDEAFDINYCQWWTQHSFPDIFRCSMPAYSLQIAYEEADNARQGAVLIRAIEHHDTANDMYEARLEKLSSEKCEASYVLCYTVPGVPFLYNGCEYSDASRHSIFGNKGQFTIDRRKAPSRRTSFLALLAKLHREEEAFRNGKILWLDHERKDALCVYIRTDAKNGEKILCAINLSNEKASVKSENISSFVKGKVLLERGAVFTQETLSVEANGFLLVKVQE